MEREVALAFREDLAKGFLLVGFRRVWYPRGEEVEESLKRWFRKQVEDDVGIIFLSSSFYKMLYNEIRRVEMEGRAYPVVVSVPEEVGEEDPIDRIIKRAIGIELKK